MRLPQATTKKELKFTRVGQWNETITTFEWTTGWFMDLVSKSAHGISAEIIIKIRNYLKKIPRKNFSLHTLSFVWCILDTLFLTLSLPRNIVLFPHGIWRIFLNKWNFFDNYYMHEMANAVCAPSLYCVYPDSCLRVVFCISPEKLSFLMISLGNFTFIHSCVNLSRCLCETIICDIRAIISS